MATGENSGAWGTITNNNLSAIEEAIARTTDVAFSATATVAITLANSNALQQGRNYRLNLTGTGTAGQILLLPTVEKSYLIDNNLSVDVSVRNGTAGGTNTFNIATVGAGRSTIVYTDGSAVTSALDSASSMVVLTTLDVGDAASVGATLGVTGNASVTGTLAIGQDLSVVRTFTFASANGTDRLGVIGDASVGGTFHIQGNTSAQGTLNVTAMDVTSTLEVVGAASVGGTLGITGNASITGTLTIADEFTFATANSTGNLGVVKNASVGGTFHIEGNTSAQGTLNVKGAVSVASTLGVEGEINNEVGNIIIDPTTKIVEIKGGGSTDGQIQLNCRSNSHGQKIMSQPHSEAITNEMLLPKGANSTLVSEAGTATITNKTLDVIPSISVTGTLKVGTTIESLSTVSDVDGNLRAVPQSRYLTTAGKHTATTTDVGNFIHLFSSDQTLLIGSAGVSNFVAGDIFTVVSHGQSANSTTTYSAAQVLAFVAGAETSTALITIANNGVSSVLFTSAGGCIITGNVS